MDFKVPSMLLLLLFFVNGSSKGPVLRGPSGSSPTISPVVVENLEQLMKVYSKNRTPPLPRFLRTDRQSKVHL